MNDRPQIPLDEHGSDQESSTQFLRQALSFITDFNCADNELTTESFSVQSQGTSHISPLKTNDETTYKLPPFETTFLKTIALDVIPSASNNESYQVPDQSEDFQFLNQAVGIDNAAQSSNGSRHSYGELIDVFNNIEPANLLEFSKVSQQKEYTVNVSSTLQLEKEVETGKKFSIKSRTAIENPSSDVLDLEVLSVPRTKENICPDCGNAFTPRTKMYQHNVVLDSCICKRKVISQSSSNRSMLSHTTDVTSVASPSHSHLFISDKAQKNLIKNCNLQRNKQFNERSTCTNNAHEVQISAGTQHHKHADVPHMPYVKRLSKVISSFRTSRDMPGNYSRKYLESEVSSSSELKGNICQVCGIDFMFKSKLDRHSVVHTGEKPFVCDICPKSYSRKDGLNEHKMVHHPETFQLPKANSSVISNMPGNSSSEDLVIKVALSSKFKRHKCQECGKLFGKKSDLDRHSVVHTGEKPFVCDICQKAFSQKGSLKTHMKSHHPEAFQM